MKDGDIFHWRYKYPNPDWSNVTYWAKSCIGVVVGGFLADTFWIHDLTNPRVTQDTNRWSVEEAAEKLDLDFIANMADLEKVDEWKLAYYADVDVVNLNHSNSSKGNAYIRKGAKRSSDKMLESARYNVQKALARIDTLNHSITRLQELEAAIMAGDPLDELYLIEIA